MWSKLIPKFLKRTEWCAKKRQGLFGNLFTALDKSTLGRKLIKDIIESIGLRKAAEKTQRGRSKFILPSGTLADPPYVTHTLERKETPDESSLAGLVRGYVDVAGEEGLLDVLV